MLFSQSVSSASISRVWAPFCTHMTSMIPAPARAESLIRSKPHERSRVPSVRHFAALDFCILPGQETSFHDWFGGEERRPGELACGARLGPPRGKIPARPNAVSDSGFERSRNTTRPQTGGGLRLSGKHLQIVDQGNGVKLAE